MASLLHRLLSGDEEVANEQAVLEEHPSPAHVETDAAAPEQETGLIPATKLPSAASSLAELFADEAPVVEAEEAVAESPVEEAPSPAQTSAPASPRGAPIRRGLFSWLFGTRRAARASAEEETLSIEQTPDVQTLDTQGQFERVVAVEPAPAEEAVIAEASSLTEAEDALPATEELMSAVDALGESLPAEEAAAQPDLGDVSEAAVEHATEPEAEFASQPAGDANGAVQDVRDDEHDDEPTFEIEYDAPMEEQSPELEAAVEELKNRHSPAEELEEVRDEVRDEARQEVQDEIPEEVAQAAPLAPSSEEVEAVEAAAPAEPHEAPRRAYKEWAFDEKLASHAEWLDSHGATGKKADFSGAELEATELIGVNLRLADLHDVNLRGSDLLLADLREACLVRADLEEASLVGANLEGANLEGASLETAMGLVPRQFAGANLRDALLTPHLMEFEAVPAFERASQNAFHYFAAMTGLSALSWLVIWKTKDIQLLTDSAVIPFLHSRAAATALPTAESYLIVPVALFILYLVFHFHLQHLWDSVGELPAIFPDGHTLGDRGPGIVVGLLRAHFRWINPDPSSTRLVEKGVCLFVAYWVVPGTLLLFWLRYLTRQDIHGTLLQAALVVIATAIAFYATTKVGRPHETWGLDKKLSQRLASKVRAGSPFSLGAALGALLLIFSVGAIAGIPHERGRAPQYRASSIRRWIPDVFWYLSFDPYADLTEGVISRKPANWTGGDEQVASVDGLRMNNANFRYAQAYGAFLANAHLWHADFQGAFLSDADLRGVDFGESNLRYAVMDHAQMSRVNLYRSDMDGADLRRANLHGANLSYCGMQDAILVDAQLDGANLYAAHLISATLTRANLEKADLRESFLNVAHMDHVDLRGAYLWSAKLPGADLGGAQLGNAILIGADLRGVNLGGAQLSGTVLNDADMSGTSLEGADLRGALGLTASQVCSARSRRGALLDDALATQVEAQCGAAK